MLYLYLRIWNWVKREEGQDLVEYALLLALIALFCVVAIGVAGTSVSRIWTNIAGKLATVLP